MVININTVRNAFEDKGWKLLSTSYKNLTSDLEAVCPCGHEIKTTYGDWRKNAFCPECLRGDPFRVKNVVPKKKAGTKRVLALDAATTTTGYALYDDKELVKYGHFTVAGNDTTQRIHEVGEWLNAIIGEWRPDFVCIEQIQLQSFGDPKTSTFGGNLQVELFQILANLQGVLQDILFVNQMPYELIYAATWRKFCGVVGKKREDKKKSAQLKVSEWYGISATQDEADAICLGKYAIFNINITKNWGESL